MSRLITLALLACMLAVAGSHEREQDRLQHYCDTQVARAGMQLKCVVLVVNADGVGYPDSSGMSEWDSFSRTLIVWVLSRDEYGRLKLHYLDAAHGITATDGKGPRVRAKADQEVTVRHEIGHVLYLMPWDEDAAIAFAAASKRHWRN